MAEGVIEVPYDEADLGKLKKQDLVAIVRHQLAKWPTDASGKFNESKTTISAIKMVLLDPTHGFTKAVAVSAPPQPLAAASSTSNERTQSQLDTNVEPLSEAATGVPAVPLSGHRISRHARCRLKRRYYMPSAHEEVHSMRLYIDDMRQKGEIFRTATNLKIAVVDRRDCGPDEWHANTHDLLRKLQQTAAALTGPVRLSYPDKLYPQYNVCFLKTQPGEAIKEAEPDTELLVIPDSDAFQLIVEQAGGGFGDTLVAASGSTAIVDAQVEWLAERAKEQAGYGAFKNGQHRVQCNADIVASWRFAADFCEQYNKKSISHIGSVAITKNVIQKALGVGSTWFSEAENALRIIRIYGEGGIHARQAVIEAVAS
ncbi:hypothetical protein BJ138DRAFT_1131082 [Hygrophoropsis aurantiaca]|uniref:Uncharacterized protein n=1 Tax=Hygrophoropsis aurantiaca TaxID=72124 RepID=A0ACB7ZSN5_9AGAM|nr:hypothetical protein BJ138DRAFT_1131082 [Hygrophoropsis aurantiaca]